MEPKIQEKGYELRDISHYAIQIVEQLPRGKTSLSGALP
jgi:hypothetical protein